MIVSQASLSRLPSTNCQGYFPSNTAASDKIEMGSLGLFSAALGLYRMITLQSPLGANHHFGYEEDLHGDQHSKAGAISQERNYEMQIRLRMPDASTMAIVPSVIPLSSPAGSSQSGL